MAEKKIDPREELSQKVEQCLTVQDIHKKVTLANDYRKRFECKNCSKWFHSNKTLFDKGRRKYTYLACPDCKWYTLLCKPDYRKRNLKIYIYRFFSKRSLVAQFVKLQMVVPQVLLEDLPLVDSSCEDSGIE